MIAPWMLYTVAIGAALALAAQLCEHGLALLDRPGTLALARRDLQGPGTGQPTGAA